MTYKEKLNAIRQQMQTEGIAAYIIPSADPHISEYLPDHYRSIAFTTGFTGSVSTVVITQNFAGLWADSRYYVQAEEQLRNSGFELVKLKAQGVPEYVEWLAENLNDGDTVAFDENTVSVVLGLHLEKLLAPKKVKFLNRDFVGNIWENRPQLPSNLAFLINDEFIGQSVESKLAEIRKALKKSGAEYHLVSSLDDMAWIFNLRGTDVSYNPVVLSFALITNETASIYIEKAKLTSQSITKLESAGVKVKEYNAIRTDLEHIPAHSTIFVDPKRNCFALYKKIPVSVNKVLDTNPSTVFKAIKNETEIRNTRNTMIKDGAAMTLFFQR